MATEEVEMATTEEVPATETTETPETNGTPEVNGTPATNGTTNGKSQEEEEEHTTEFPGYPQYMIAQLQAQRADQTFTDGKLVFTSGDKRRRMKVLLSSVAIGAIKLNRAFLNAKRSMMEAGYMNTTIELEIPDFHQEGQSLPESAVKSVFNFIYTGQLDVNSMNLKNVAVLAHYMEIEPITSRIEELAGQLGVEVDNEDLKSKAEAMGNLRVVGMDKFIKAGFGNAPRQNVGGKRPNTPKKTPVPEKKQKTLEEPKPEEAVEIAQADEAEAAGEEEEATTIEQTDDAEMPAEEEAAEEAAEPAAEAEA